MRITTKMTTDNAVRHMSENQSTLHKLQEKTASGKNFQYASESPSAASLSLTLRSTIQTSQTYLDTANLTNDWMAASEFAFQQMDDLGLRAKNLVLSGLNDTLGAEERQTALASEINGILENAMQIANTSHKGQYIFSGFQINTKPFSPIFDLVELDKIIGIDYDGDNGVMQRSLGPAQTVTMNINADTAFRPFMESLIQIRDALNANDTTVLRTALNGLESSVNQLDQFRTSLGTRMRQVASTSDYLEKTQIELKSLLSQNEDANMAEAISLMRNQEITYQAVLEVGSRAISALNLFEYLR
ncbi:MAG: hypothetical protein CVU39_09545 [Chloroflexi bacterium HGW-Chloroflexi-10]|nr:MAG: hypothetical protein CVU39_09545 [Chloroflexi bacterium HGW-Chloroflexi-10]